MAENTSGVTRRRVLAGAGVGAAFSIVAPHVLGGPGKKAPSDKVALAGVGVGGVGHGQIRQCQAVGFQVVALCDVDDQYAKKTFDKNPSARRYRDFRQMLQAEGDKVDAVYCGTPDHTHAAISLAALKAGKHVLTVKPLTRTVWESRVLARAAKAAGTMTQMTASPASTESGCRTCEVIWDGAIGDVHEAHIWSNRPIWPQGMTRPEGADAVPKTLDWDLWLGPAAKRPFKANWPAGSLPMAQCNGRPPRAVYHPWNFRGWYDFGTGALGDMGCHHWNTPRRALKLGLPTAISASCTRVMPESWPLASVITWEFPQRDGMVPVRITWYDGGLLPPRPAELEAGRNLPRSGILYVGSKGTMLANGTSGIPRIIPESKRKAYKAPPKTLRRRSGIYGEWIEACRGGQPPSETWQTCAAALTEIVVLGNLAVRQAGKRLEYDAANMKFPNDKAATKLLKPDYQNGWKLEAAPGGEVRSKK
jgi:predicted dehydrogenase